VQKIQSSHQYLFALLGSAPVTAACKMLMKLSPDLHDIFLPLRSHLSLLLLRGFRHLSLPRGCRSNFTLMSNIHDCLRFLKSQPEVCRSGVNFINILQAAFYKSFL